MGVGVVTKLVLAVLRYPPEPADPAGSAQSVREVSVSPRYLAYRMVKLWARLLIVFAFEEAFLHKVVKGPVPLIVKLCVFLVIVGVPGALGSFVTFVEYKVRSYKLSDRALRIREGLFFVRETTMTFANVQSVNVSRGPLQGIFGISDLVMKTAGGGAGDDRMKGLRPDLHVAHLHGLRNADEVRELVLQLLKKTKDAGLGPTGDSHRSATVGQASGEGLTLDEALLEIQRAATSFREAAERA